MKILMVCLGNICRSPLADGILRIALDNNNLTAEVDSCGTSGHHQGEAPDRRMSATALKHGYNISFLRSRKLQKNDLEEFDIIYAMDKENYKNTLAIAKNDSQKQKVRLYLNELYPGENMEVPDPYYGGDSGFEHVFNLIKETTEVIITKIKNNELV